MIHSLPPRLRELYEAYQLSGGNYLLQGPVLTEKWLQVVGSSGKVGEQVSRQSICTAWRGANDEFTTTKALFLTMVWGYGSMRFGRRNTRLAIESVRDGKWRQLKDIRNTAASDASRALEELSGLRIRGLGIAFQTKILYGMSGHIPVLDRHTRAWLHHHGFDEVGRASSDLAAFISYNNKCLSWSRSPIGTGKSVIGDPCLIEYLMFWDAKRGRKRIIKGSPKWLVNTESWGR